MTGIGYRDREQSELKHHAIKLYLQAAARIVGSFWNLKYVDCCAGPWQSTESNYSDTSFGIALEALRETRQELAKRKRFLSSECLFIEKDKAPFLKLEAFAKANDSPGGRVRAENWNFAEHVNDIAQYCSTPKTFSFILIDPWGWKLAGLSQISPLLKLRPGERY